MKYSTRSLSVSRSAKPLEDAIHSAARRRAVFDRACELWNKAPRRTHAVRFRMFGRRIEATATNLGRLVIMVR